MTKLGGEEPDDFVSDLMSRYEAFSRNQVRDKLTGEEVIIPVSENTRVREELQQMIDELCAVYLVVSDEQRDHLRKLVQEHRPLHNGLLAHIGGRRNTNRLTGSGGDWQRHRLKTIERTFVTCSSRLAGFISRPAERG